MPLREVTVPGLPQLGVEAVSCQHGLQYEVVLLGQSEVCPVCGTKLRRSGAVSTRLFDLPRGLQASRLHLRAVRYVCPAACVQLPPFLGIQAQKREERGKQEKEKRRRGYAMTQRLLDALVWRYVAGETVPSLAQWSGLKPDTLAGILSDELAYLDSLPRDLTHLGDMTHIAIDEIFWRGRVLCVVMDLGSGRLLDLLPDRDIVTVTEFLTELKDMEQGRPDWSPIFVTDMWGEYRLAIRSVFGSGARQVADRFHLLAKIPEQLHEQASVLLRDGDLSLEARRELLQQLRSTYLLRLREEEGPHPTFPPEVQRLLDCACALERVWHQSDVQAHYDAWAWETGLSFLTQAKPFEQFQWLVAQWRSEVFAAYDPAYALPDGRRPTSGPLESLNGRLQRMAGRSGIRGERPFRGGGEQEHFQRFRLRALMTQGVWARPEIRTYQVTLRPSVTPCSCGLAPAPTDIRWRRVNTRRELPLGRQPVQGVAEAGQWHCPGCGADHEFSFPIQAVSDELAKYVQQRRKQGASIACLKRETGISRAKLMELLPETRPRSPIAPPETIGLTRWYWRGGSRWVLTDPKRGKLLDILPDAEVRTLEAALAGWGQGVRTVLLEYPEWRAYLPPPCKGALDPMSVKRVVQLALVDVQRRFTATTPAATRRTPRYHRHRRLLLSRLDKLSISERARLEDLLGAFPELRKAHELMQEFHARYDHSAQASALAPWAKQIDALVLAARPYQEMTPIQRSLTYAWRDALAALRSYRQELAEGLKLREQGINLASSRRLLHQLNRHEAAGQSDFELLRNAALQELGPCP